MSPSSTSSSDVRCSGTLVGPLRPTPAAWIGVGLCVVARLLFWWQDDLLRRVDAEQASRSFLVSELRYRVQGPRAPEVVVVGTSRLADMTAADIDAARSSRVELGLYAWPGNTFWDVRQLLSRNPELTSRCRLFVLDAVPTLWLTAFFTPRKFLRGASLEERLALPPSLRMGALVDPIHPLWSSRHSAGEWLAGLPLAGASEERALAELEREWGVSIAVSRALSAEWRRRNGAAFNPVTLDFVAARGNERDAGQTAAFDDILSGLPEGCRVLLVVLPLRAALVEAIEADPRRAESWRGFERELVTRTGPDVELEILTQEDLSLTDFDYVDGLHFGPTGLERVARALAGLIDRELSEAEGGAPPP